MAYEILKADEYKEWFESLTKKEKWQIEERLDGIANDGHLGYIAVIPPYLLGGYKANAFGRNKDYHE